MNNEEFIFLNDNFEEGNEIEKDKENTSYIYSLIDINNAIYIKKDISKEDIIKKNNIPEEIELTDLDVDIYINSKFLKSIKIESLKQNLTNLRNKLELSKKTFFLLNENEKDGISEDEEQKYLIKDILKNNKNIYLFDKYYDIKIIIYFEKKLITQYIYNDIINEKLNEFRKKLNYNKK